MNLVLKLSLAFAIFNLALPTAPAQYALKPGGVGRATNGRTFIVIADGAGAYSTLANNLQDVVYDLPVAACACPIVHAVEWSTGNNLFDYRSRNLHWKGGCRIAWEIQHIRRLSPDSPIVLVGYSAGASVALSAAEQLPACSVDRIVLLGPAVASNYDVRPALRASRLGIDSFYIPNDQWLMDIEELYGAPYGPPGSTVAGSTGFTMVQRRAYLHDPSLYKFREHAFAEVQGDHFGTVKPNFLRNYVMPLIPR